MQLLPAILGLVMNNGHILGIFVTSPENILPCLIHRNERSKLLSSLK